MRGEAIQFLHLCRWLPYRKRRPITKPRFEAARDDTRAEALARLDALRRPLPKGFRFDRDDANER